MTIPRLAPSGAPPLPPDRLLPPFLPRDDAENWLFGLERLGIRPGLERIAELLDALGHPEGGLPALVVAGTNGKGTTTHLLGDRLRDLGQRVGVYTSPHLLDLCERIQIDGAAIDRESLAAAVERVKPHAQRCEATFFESFTALALDLFARAGVESTVLEVGLGGRWDATNAARKRAVFLCSISSDHEEILGPAIEDIAREKLGLASPGVPFYVGDLDPALAELARETIESAGAIHIPWHELPPCDGEEERAQVFASERQRMLSRFVDRALLDISRREGWLLDARKLRPGRCPARLERYGRTPELWVDTAHNAQALAALAESWGPARPGDMLLFGCMEGKRVDPIFPLLPRMASEIVVTAPRWHRSRDAGELANSLRAAGASSVHEQPRVVDALEFARRRIGKDGRVLVCGSNFLVAEVLDRLGVDRLDAPPEAPLWDTGVALRRRGDEAA